MPGTRTGAYASCGDAQIPYDRSKRLADEHKNLAGHQTDLESRPMSQKYSFRFMHLRDEALRDLRTIEKDEDGVRELVIHRNWEPRRSTPSPGISEKAWTMAGSRVSSSSTV